MIDLTRWLLRGLMLAVAVPASAVADNGMMDAGFGSRGFVQIDSALGDTSDDRAVGICPGTGDTQVLIGLRRSPAMLTLARLLPNGSLDASFGVGGRVEYAVEMPSGAVRNLCLGEGRVEIAYATTTGKLEVLRVGASGQPDPGFGNSGRLVVDPATLPGSNSGFLVLRSMDRGGGGEILVGGEVGGSGIGDGRPVLIRVNANGSLRDARVFQGGAHALGGYAAAAGYAPDGNLWMAGVSRQDGGNGWCFTWFRQVLNGVTLGGDSVELGPTGPWSYAVHGGRMLRPGVMALGMHLRANAGGVWVPRVQILRATGSSEVALPLLPGYGEMAGSALNLLAMDAGTRLVYASSMSSGNGIYLARLHVGTDAAGDGLDASFGRQGVNVVAMPGRPPGCADGAVPVQSFTRLSLWGSLPLFTGTVAVSCSPGSATDLLVGRLSEVTDRIFADDLGV